MKTWNCRALTGGTTRALDAIAISSLTDLDRAHVIFNNLFYCYEFDADATDAESSPITIRPDTYVSAGVWKLTGSPYGDLNIGPEVLTGLPVTGGITGGDITRASNTTLTITPISCLSSTLTVKLYVATSTTFTVPHTGAIAANTIYHIFLVKLTGGTFEFRTYTTEAAVASDAAVTAYRWVGFWRTNGSSQLVVANQKGNMMWFGKASENVLSNGITTAYATVTHSTFLPESRIAEIQYATRDASVNEGYMIMSDDGTNVSATSGATDADVDDTSRDVWGSPGHGDGYMIPYLAGRSFKSSSGTLDLLIHGVRVFR